MARRSKFSPEVRERGVRLVKESQGEHPSEWRAICSVAGKLGCTAVPSAGAPALDFRRLRGYASFSTP